MRKMMLTVAGALCAAAALIASPAAAQVPDTYARQLAAQLVQVESVVTGDGYRRVQGPITGGLADNARFDHLVTLQAGRSYKIIGVCDNDCTDVDIRLYDQNNNLIDEDLLVDDLPIVDVTPQWTGPFRVQVIMATCNVAPCYYAFNVYGR